MAASSRGEFLEQFDSRSCTFATTIRALDLTTQSPQTLEELWILFEPLRRAIPELSRYSLSTPEGRREFPRTATGLVLLGSLLRASDALDVLSGPASIEARNDASATVLREWERFVAPQHRSARPSYEQFIALVELFRPFADNSEAVTAMAVTLIYGDLCKIPEVQAFVEGKIGSIPHDHDAALRAIFQPENIGRCSELFPTLSSLTPQFRERIQTEILYGPHLGHILECLTCAATLVEFQLHTAGDTEALSFWLLPTLLDILAARADQATPETWRGSVLGNESLVSSMLVFAQHLPRLHTDGARSFYDGFQREISKRPFYKPIFSDTELSPQDKEIAFRLSRFLTWETDQRDIDTLLSVYKGRTIAERGVLSDFFLNDGLSRHESPKPIITYFPYVFSQLYAKHLPLAEAIDKTVTTLCHLLSRVEECELYDVEQTQSGYRLYAGQRVWFDELRSMVATDVVGNPIRLGVVVRKGTPEVIMESALLAESERLRRVFLNSLQEATDRAMPACEGVLLARLSPLERRVFSFVQSHNYVDGAWYRPIHNVVVPLAMIDICEKTGASRDLVLAALLHDIGYAGLKIPGTLEGAKWDSKDVRETHMAASAQMSHRYLSELRVEGALELSCERIDKLVEIIATHDNPYIGIPLTDHEALLHRDADRAFVISTVSFWKDYLAYLSDPKHIKRFADADIQLTPKAFLELRMSGFDATTRNTMSRFTSFEPMKSDAGSEICKGQLARREAEVHGIFSSLHVAAGLQERLIETLRATIEEDVRATT